MVKIPLSEFDELLYAATFLRYYWAVFRGMNQQGNITCSHEAFICDCLENERLAEFTVVKRTAFNKIILSEKQLMYLIKVATVTTELKELIWANE